MNDQNTFFITGGFFAEMLAPCLSSSLQKTGVYYQFPHDYTELDKFIKDYVLRLEEKIISHRSEYLVLELRSLLELIDLNKYNEEELARQQLDTLIKVIRAHYSAGKVLIIKSNIPKYYIMADHLIKEVHKDAEKKQRLKILNKWEKYLQNKVNGVLINTTQFYFYSKKRGYLLNDRTYEDECYIDISRKIEKYVLNKKKIASVPNTTQSINRYIKYAGSTNLFKAFDVFLNPEKLMDSMITSAPDKFVKTYKKYLIQARKIKQDDYNAWKESVRKTFAADLKFCNILLAYRALLEGNYNDDSISYRELFVNAVVNRSVISVLQNYVRDNNIADPKQINAHNAGYYYALMIGQDSSEAETFVESGTVLAPILMDVFGSCVSRTCLRERYSGNTDLVANNYWFQIPPYTDDQPVIDYDEEIFSGLKGLFNYNTKLQFDHKVLDSIRNSTADWILIDLQGLVSPSTHSYKGFLFSDFAGTLSKQLGLESVSVCEDERLLGNWEDIFKKMDGWIDAINKKYKSNIILLDINMLYISKGDDNVFYTPRGKKNFEYKNLFLKEAFEYVKERLNGYTIELSHKFCPDDCGFSKRSSLHYSYDFFRQVYQIIHYIVQNTPEQKVFCEYDHAVRVKRMADMLEYNSIDMVKRFFTLPLDNVVLSLSSTMIRENKALITSWYEQELSGKEDLLRIWSANWNNELKDAIFNSQIKRKKSEKTLQNDYPEEPVICKAYKYENLIPLIGHRGYSGIYPQNSMLAFEEAYKNDFDGIEIDLWESYNGDLIIAHDMTTDRLFGQKGSVRKINNVSRYSYPQIAGNGIENLSDTAIVVPTLEELFRLFSKKQFTIYLHIKEMKNGSYVLDRKGAKRILHLIHAYGMEKQVVIFSTKFSVLAYFKNSPIRLGRLTGKYDRSILEQTLTQLKEVGGDTLILTEIDILREQGMGKEFVSHCHRLGIKVGSYYTRTVEDYRFLHAVGADFSMADYQLTELMEQGVEFQTVMEAGPRHRINRG